MAEWQVEVCFRSCLRDESGEEQRTEEQYRGWLRFTDGVWGLEYHEESPEGDITEVRVEMRGSDQDQVLIERNGDVCVRMLFLPGQLTESQYQTPYGSFPAVFAASQVLWRIGPKEGIVLIGYEVALGGAPPMKASIEMRLLWNRQTELLHVGEGAKHDLWVELRKTFSDASFFLRYAAAGCRWLWVSDLPRRGIGETELKSCAALSLYAWAIHDGLLFMDLPEERYQELLFCSCHAPPGEWDEPLKRFQALALLLQKQKKMDRPMPTPKAQRRCREALRAYGMEERGLSDWVEQMTCELSEALREKDREGLAFCGSMISAYLMERGIGLPVVEAIDEEGNQWRSNGMGRHVSN